MMKSVMKSVLVLVLLGISGVASSGQWSEYGQVRNVMYYEDGTLHVWATFPRLDPAGCGNARYVMAASHPNIMQTYASALVAFGKKANARFFVDADECQSLNPKLRAIELMQTLP